MQRNACRSIVLRVKKKKHWGQPKISINENEKIKCDIVIQIKYHTADKICKLNVYVPIWINVFKNSVHIKKYMQHGTIHINCHPGSS